MSTNMAFTHEGRNGIPEGSSSILKQALYESPLIYLHDAKGYWYSNNPLAVLNRNIDNMSRNRLDMNLSLDAKILKVLSYQFKFSYYTVHETDNSFTGVWGLDEDFIMPGSLSQVDKYQNTANKSPNVQLVKCKPQINCACRANSRKLQKQLAAEFS